MARSRYYYYEDVWNSEINHQQKGMMKYSLKELFSSTKDRYYVIPLAHRYRPDLITKKFYGDSSLAWVLVFVNNISNSPEGFEAGTRIRVPDIDHVLGLV